MLHHPERLNTYLLALQKGIDTSVLETVLKNLEDPVYINGKKRLQCCPVCHVQLCHDL